MALICHEFTKALENDVMLAVFSIEKDMPFKSIQLYSMLIFDHM